MSIIADKYPSKNCTIKYILDNFGLIQQKNEHLDYDIPYPNTTLQAEYDIIEHIYQINKLHNVQSPLQIHMQQNGRKIMVVHTFQFCMNTRSAKLR